MQNTQAQAAPPADPGFRLPGANDAPANPPAPATRQVEIAPVAGAPLTDTSSRDLAIGTTIFLVLLVVYFFARHAFVHYLVVRRVAPSVAGSAGWLLFVGLAFVSAAAVLAIVNASQFLSFAITFPLVLVGLIALGAALYVGRR